MKDNEECSRKESLKRELLNDWNKLNIAAKFLIILGFEILFVTIALSCMNSLSDSIGVVFRSLLASVFGFFLSSNIKGQKKTTKTMNKYRIEPDCEDEIKKYNFEDGNLVQMLIAFSICMICMLSIIILAGFNITNCLATLSQLRDLMCASIGFLLGEAKIKK